VTVHHAATFDQALHALAFVLGWSGGIMEIRTWREGRGEHRDFLKTGTGDAGRRLARFVRETDERYSSEVLLGVPATKRARGGVAAATAFWVRVEGTEQNRWLASFQPQPTIVLREGSSSRRWALWALEYPVRWAGVDRGNRRLAHRMRAPKKWAEPENLWLPAPGSCLRRHGGRPVPIVVERLEAVTFEPLGVIGAREIEVNGRVRRFPALKDAPAADAWMKRQTGAT
jgi:hypothetical protein